MPSLALLLVAGLIALTACSGATSNGEPLGARVAAAKKSFDQAKFIGFTLTGSDLPTGVSALASAEGTGTHAPAFTGKIEVSRGFSFGASLRAIDGKVYAELPFVGWTTIDPGHYGAPDPAALMDRSTGLSSLLTDTAGAKIEGSERSGSVVLTKIGGTVPGRFVHALFPSAALSTYQIEFAVTAADDLHSVTLTGPFYAGHGASTYAIVLDLSADPVTITAPR